MSWTDSKSEPSFASTTSREYEPASSEPSSSAPRKARLSVSKIYPEVVDGNFEIDLVFDEDLPSDIRRGQTLRIRLMLGEPAESTLVEKGGFYQETGGQWIFVLDDSGDEAQRQTIELGRSNSLEFEVLRGLEPGDRVIISPYDDFEDVDRLLLK